jgi:quercetin dioxygenase-like cupin family protein
MTRRTAILSAAIGVAAAAITGTATATPPVGQTTTVLARGTTDHLRANHDGVRLITRHDVSADVAVATVTFPPGGSSGWHHHPGVVVVVVRSGEVTFYDNHCRAEVHKAGSTFLESSDAPGLATNHGTEDAVVEATFIMPASTPPAPATPLRIDDAAPRGCLAT